MLNSFEAAFELDIIFIYFNFFQNMFLAIINDSYVVVKEEMNLEKEDFEVGDYLKRGYNNVLVSFSIQMTKTNDYLNIC